MKRLLSAFVSALLAVALAVPAMAYTLPDTTTEDGNTILGLFGISKGTPEQKAFIEEWKASSHNFLMMTASESLEVSYYFVIVPDDSTVSISNYGSGTFVFTCNKALRYLSFDSPNEKGLRLPYDLVSVAPNFKLYMSALVSTTHQMSFPTLPFDYIARFSGNFIIRFDDEEEVGGSWWEHLLDWLKSFWDKLLQFFISIFVPDEGYFSEWFETIRAALDKKVGGITMVFDAISAGFDSLKNPSSGGVSFKLPDNFYYPGFKGVDVDLLSFIAPILEHVRGWLNAIVVIITCIFCYKKLISLVNT